MLIIISKGIKIIKNVDARTWNFNWNLIECVFVKFFNYL